jgi:hypothetical protein
MAKLSTLTQEQHGQPYCLPNGSMHETPFQILVRQPIAMILPRASFTETLVEVVRVSLIRAR